MRCALREKCYITNMRAKRAENFDLLTFAPPPPIRKTDRRPCLWYGAIYTRHYTDKTLKLREIYEYASELKFFDIFTIGKTLISFIILLVLQILSLSLKLNICIHKKQSLHFPCNMYPLMV